MVLFEMPMNSVAKTKLAVKELQGDYLVQTIDNKQLLALSLYLSIYFFISYSINFVVKMFHYHSNK